MSYTSVLISFDPASFRNLGWSLITITEDETSITDLNVKAGTIVMPSVSEPHLVLWPLWQAVDEILTGLKPELAIVEKTSSFAGGFITGQVSNCMGVILACCTKHNIPVQFVFPSHVHKVITGKGKTTKSAIKHSVKSILESIADKQLNFEFDSEHAYDAVANLLCFLKDKNFLEFEAPNNG